MKTLSIFLFVVVVFATFATSAIADEKAALDAAYCPALADEKSYEKNGLDNYKAIIRGKDDWLFRSAVAFKSDFAVNAKTTALLKKLQDDLKAKGTDLIIALPPAAGAAVNSEFLSDESIVKYKFDPVAAKKTYVDALAAMKAAGLNVAGVTDYPVGKAFFYKRDHHWNPDGAKATAQSVAALIKTLPAYEGLPKTEFVTKVVGEKEYRGSYIRAFIRICNKRPPTQKIVEYKTQQMTQKSGAGDLFGVVHDAPIVLVGTSNSAPDPDVSNFAGFLKDAASLDVENLAMSGARVEASLLKYLKSENFKKSPAKILVWEVPGYYDLNNVVQKLN
jgi:alginate biosynthesis protein AlgX